MEIGEFGVGRPDFGGRWPRGEALGKKKGYGARYRDTKTRTDPCVAKDGQQFYSKFFCRQVDPATKECASSRSPGHMLGAGLQTVETTRSFS